MFLKLCKRIPLRLITAGILLIAVIFGVVLALPTRVMAADGAFTLIVGIPTYNSSDKTYSATANWSATFSTVTEKKGAYFQIIATAIDASKFPDGDTLSSGKNNNAILAIQASALCTESEPYSFDYDENQAAIQNEYLKCQIQLVPNITYKFQAVLKDTFGKIVWQSNVIERNIPLPSDQTAAQIQNAIKESGSFATTAYLYLGKEKGTWSNKSGHIPLAEWGEIQKNLYLLATADLANALPSQESDYYQLFFINLDPKHPTTFLEAAASASVKKAQEIVGVIIGAPLKLALKTLTNGLVGLINGMSKWIADEGLLAINTKNFATLKPVSDYMTGVANVVFIIFLALIGLANIVSFNIDKYAIRKVIPYLLIAIVLVNLAPTICSSLTDVSNTLTNSVLNQELLKNTFGGQFGAADVEGVTWALLGSFVLGIVIFVIFWVAILLYVIVGFLRQIGIFMLAILAPVAFAAFAFPATQNLFKMWWKWFFNLIVMGILMAFALYLTGFILQQTGVAIGPTAGVGVTGFTNPARGAFQNANFFNYLLAAILLAATAIIPARFGGKYFGFAGKMMGNAIKALPKIPGAIRAVTAGGVRALGQVLPKESEIGKKLRAFRPEGPIAKISRAKQALADIRKAEEERSKGEWSKRILAMGKVPFLGEIFLPGVGKERAIQLEKKEAELGSGTNRNLYKAMTGRGKNGKLLTIEGKEMTAKNTFAAEATPGGIEQKLSTASKTYRAYYQALDEAYKKGFVVEDFTNPDKFEDNFGAFTKGLNQREQIEFRSIVQREIAILKEVYTPEAFGGSANFTQPITPKERPQTYNDVQQDYNRNILPKANTVITQLEKDKAFIQSGLDIKPIEAAIRIGDVNSKVIVDLKKEKIGNALRSNLDSVMDETRKKITDLGKTYIEESKAGFESTLIYVNPLLKDPTKLTSYSAAIASLKDVAANDINSISAYMRDPASLNYLRGMGVNETEIKRITDNIAENNTDAFRTIVSPRIDAFEITQQVNQLYTARKITATSVADETNRKIELAINEGKAIYDGIVFPRENPGLKIAADGKVIWEGIKEGI